MVALSLSYPILPEKPWLFALCFGVALIASWGLFLLCRWRRWAALGHTEGLTVKDSDSPIEKEFETPAWRISDPRTAALIVRLASRFRSEISLSDGEATVNAKEILGVMMLQSEADSKTLPDSEVMKKIRAKVVEKSAHCPSRIHSGLKAGSRIRVTARGPDAAAAMDALSELFSIVARIDLCIEPGCPCRNASILTGYTPDIIYYACPLGHAWAVSRSDRSKVQRTSPTRKSLSCKENFSEIKFAINNVLAVMTALSEMSRRRSDYSEKLARVVLMGAPRIVSSLQEFTQALNEKAGPKPEVVELQEKFFEIKHTINTVLAAMMALAEMSQRRPDYSEKLANVVLTKAPLIVSSLQEFAQALNEKDGPKPEVGQ
jgi:phosphotransferase system HPr (HPr) family protein